MQPDEIKLGDTPTKQKENSVKPRREPTPVDQWDIIAHTLIKQELAPKGYSDIKSGDYRGKVKSNIPFLPKQSVIRCQNISAQLVRAYREELRAWAEGELKKSQKGYEDAKEQYAKTPWYKFTLRGIYRGLKQFYNGQTECFQQFLIEIDQIKVPTK
jgi:hypothetical protein